MQVNALSCSVKCCWNSSSIVLLHPLLPGYCRRIICIAHKCAVATEEIWVGFVKSSSGTRSYVLELGQQHAALAVWGGAISGMDLCFGICIGGISNVLLYLSWHYLNYSCFYICKMIFKRKGFIGWGKIIITCDKSPPGILSSASLLCNMNKTIYT